MSEPVKILVVDDEESMRDMLQIVLEKRGYRVVTAEDAQKALKLTRKHAFSLIIQDVRMPGMDGLKLLELLKREQPDTPILIITAYSTWDTAQEAIRLGADDYIRKPFRTEQILATIQHLLEQKKLREAGLADPLAAKGGIIIGANRKMREIFELVKQIAPTDSTVLIQGASGTGKELVARIIHCLSKRAAKPFICVNCGAFPDTLLESELFGYKKGAFTGAYEDKKGLMVLANEGTLFLDEIAEMTPKTQVKLLRVLEERKVLPLGGTEEVPFTARLIAATNRPMEEEVARGTFRKDLYYRLNVIPIHLPPLKERKEDIPLLTGHFISKYARRMGKDVIGLGPEARRALLQYDWPGNVRALENVIQRYVALATGPIIEKIDLPKSSQTAEKGPAEEFQLPEEGIDLESILEKYERRYVEAALERTNWNMAKAAKLLGLTYRSIRYKVKKLGLIQKAFEPRA